MICGFEEEVNEWIWVKEIKKENKFKKIVLCDVIYEKKFLLEWFVLNGIYCNLSLFYWILKS